jgi:hypothetical protein
MIVGGYSVGFKRGMSKTKCPQNAPMCDPMMSFQLQPPNLLPFTLGPPSFHPWLCQCFEPDRNVGPSEWGGTLFAWAFNNSINNHGVKTQLPCGSMTTIDEGAIDQLEWYWLKNNWEMWWRHFCSIH